MKKGFTLVELLTVIAILAILTLTAVPIYNNVASKMREKAYESKIDTVKVMAEKYNEETNETLFYINTLIKNGYLEADNEDGEYLSPIDDTLMNCYVVNVSFQNEQNYTSVTKSDKTSCDNEEELLEESSNVKLKVYETISPEKEAVYNEDTSWLKYNEVYIKYELKYPLNENEEISGVTWSGEEEKTCTKENLSDCLYYKVTAENTKNVVVNIKITITNNDANQEIILTNKKRILLDTENPEVVDGTIKSNNSLTFKGTNPIELDATDKNGSGLKYYAIIPSNCPSQKYNDTKKLITSNHIVEYVGGETDNDTNTTYNLCLEDKVGNISSKNLEVFRLTLDTQGGTLTPNITHKTLLKGNSYGLLPTPIRENYTFLGWYTGVGKTGTKVNINTIINSNTTIYAAWEPNGYMISYDYTYNGGTSSNVTSAFVPKGNNANLGYTASKSGYTFLGWNTDPNATSALSTFTPTANTTLYAIFRKTLTVIYKDGAGTQANYTYAYNRATSASITLLNERQYSDGCVGSDWNHIYTKLGWSTGTAANGSINYSNGQTITISDNLTLYGQYRKEVKAVYNGNGGSCNRAYSSQVQYVYYNGSGSSTTVNSIRVDLDVTCWRSGKTFEKKIYCNGEDGLKTNAGIQYWWFNGNFKCAIHCEAGWK